jgi:hypothetical protein
MFSTRSPSLSKAIKRTPRLTNERGVFLGGGFFLILLDPTKEETEEKKDGVAGREEPSSRERRLPFDRRANGAVDEESMHENDADAWENTAHDERDGVTRLSTIPVCVNALSHVLVFTHVQIERECNNVWFDGCEDSSHQHADDEEEERRSPRDGVFRRHPSERRDHENREEARNHHGPSNRLDDEKTVRGRDRSRSFESFETGTLASEVD